MHARVDRAHAFVDKPCVDNRSFDEFNQLRVEEVFHVLKPAGAEVVDDQDTVVSRCQRVDEMRAYKARPTRNQISHPLWTPSAVRNKMILSPQTTRG